MIPLSLREQISLLLFSLMVLGVYGAEVFLLTRYILSRFRRRPQGNLLRAKSALILHGVALVGIAGLLYSYFIEPYWIDVNVVTIPTTRVAGPLRVVQISDLHCDRTARNEERAVRIINGLEPDIIVATGDFLNHASALPRLREMLGRLEAPLGKFAVTGNLDIRRWSDLDLFEGTGFHLLEGETVIVTREADVIGIFGRGFVLSDAAGTPAGDFPADRFDLFLFHSPDLVEDVSGRGVDLYLCGHTHGGQVALPWYGALITFSKFGKKYESGLYQVGDTTLYVNRGLGMEPRPAPQVRFFARPEIAVFDIVPSGP